MNKQKLKAIIHQKRKQERTESKKLKDQQLIDHKFQLDDHLRMPFLAVRPRVLKSAKTLHEYRTTVLATTSNITKSKSRSRLLLQEFDSVSIIGTVTDVRTHKKAHQVLVENPIVLEGVYKGSKILQSVNRQLDSHIWINADRIMSYYEENMHCKPIISIGDTIRFAGTVHAYHGRVNGQLTYKYGIRDIMIQNCGIPIKYKGKTVIQSLFNRYGDWVIKFTKIPNSRTLSQLPDSYAFRNKFTIQTSKYPHYHDRMKAIQEDIKRKAAKNNEAWLPNQEQGYWRNCHA